MSDSLRPHRLQHARPPCPSPTPGVYPNPCPLCQWCHPIISFSVVPFSSRLHSFPASGSFPVSQFFASGGFSFNISPSNEHPGLISFRMDWLDLLAVQGTLKSLFQHDSSKASILLHLVFFGVQLSHPYVTTGKTIALTRWTLVSKVMALLFNMLSRLVILSFQEASVLIWWLQSPSAVILESPQIKSATVSTDSPSKTLTVWITINCGKFWKRWEYKTTWPASWEICMQVKKQQLELNMEQKTGFKLEKEYIKAVYCHPAYFIYMQSTSCEMSGWLKQKLESRLPGEILIPQICRWYHPYGRRWRRIKILLMKVKVESEKVGLKLKHPENYDHGIWSHHFMGNRWGNSGNSVRLYFGGLPNHCRWWLQPWN